MQIIWRYWPSNHPNVITFHKFYCRRGLCFWGFQLVVIAFVEQKLENVLQNIQDILLKVSSPRSSLVKFLLLRACLWVNHLLRSLVFENELRNEFASLSSEVDLHVELEQGPEGSSLRPADVLVQKSRWKRIIMPTTGVVLHAVWCGECFAFQKLVKLWALKNNSSVGDTAVAWRSSMNLVLTQLALGTSTWVHVVPWSIEYVEYAFLQRPWHTNKLLFW